MSALRNSDESATGNLAPRWDWKQMPEGEHFVQFYETEEFLGESLAAYIKTGLYKGDGCIVIATSPHLSALEDRLVAAGLDLKAAATGGTYIPLDAAATLATVMIDGSPEPRRFAAALSTSLARASNGGRRVRIFGEMVAMLCEQGNYAAATQLEELWNGLSKTISFTLFCAYPMRVFGRAELAGALGTVCREHSRVIPAEDYSDLPTPEKRLHAIALLQQRAKSLFSEIADREEARERLRAAELQLLAREQAARAEAEAANRMKDEFLTMLSHELRTPLSSIVGWIDILERVRPDDQLHAQAVQVIKRNAKQQAQIIEDILEVSRIVSGKLRLDSRPIDLIPTINGAADAVRLALETKGVRLRFDLDSSVGLVAGDPNRLQQVIWNLLSNAVKFTPRGGQVTVKLASVDGFAVLTVADTGAGIPSQFLPFVFDRFRQADTSYSRKHGGLGLGLAIVRHIVEMHGGVVEAFSDGLDQGAEFKVRLPLAVSALSSMGGGDSFVHGGDQRMDSPPLPSLAGFKILVVDDHQDWRDLVTRFFQMQGAIVRSCGSAAGAFDILDRWIPDILISDLGMPGEDGFELIRRLRARAPEFGGNIAALAVTGYAGAAEEAAALASGYQLRLTKPVELGVLERAVITLVEQAVRKEPIR
jgi:signal transduction histidine kinase/ActR/RegA family two-component response regulator